MNTNNFRQLRKAGNGRFGLLQERAQLFVFCPKSSFENIHAGSIRLTDHFIFINISAHVISAHSPEEGSDLQNWSYQQ